MRTRDRLTIGLLLAAVLLALRALASDSVEKMTPLLLAVPDAPVPFSGSDGRVHLVYELWVTNFSSGPASLEKLEVFGDGAVIDMLDADAVAARLQGAGTRESSATMGKSSQALLFLHVTLPAGAAIPKELTHQVSVHVNAAPPGMRDFVVNGGAVEVDRRKVVVISPPLRGKRFISADSCCDSVRHMRAAMPVNGHVRVAQRFAVDWEQLDAKGRIYSGPQSELKSYTIFGQPVLAVADAVVSSVSDGAPEQTPGKYPAGISLDGADGNAVILDLGDGNYAMYAHMQPGSIKVHSGDKVKRGQVIGQVGDTGNSVVPHLHFQVMDRPSSLASNGLPYEIGEFSITGKTPGTESFDEAETKGTPLAVSSVSQGQVVREAMPLDQLIISFEHIP